MVVDLTKFRYEEVLEAVSAMNADDQLRLAQDIWESLVAERENAPITEEEKAMLDERLAEMEANPDAGIPWEEVKAELLSRRNQ